MALYELKYVKGQSNFTFVPISSSKATVSTTSMATTAQKYTCEKCGLQFVSEVRLGWHRSTHEPLKKSSIASGESPARRKLKFICPTCDFSTSERQLMIDHFSAKHCMRASDLKSLGDDQQHQHKVEDEEATEELQLTELTCVQCGFSSYDQDDFDFHTCIKPSEESNSSFSCHLCTYECLTRMGLQSHITRKHKPKGPKQENAPITFSCDECDYKCANKSTLYSHKRKHRAKAAKSIVGKAKQRSTTQQPARKFFCNECDYSSAKKSAMFQHIKRNHRAGDKTATASNAASGRKDLFSCDQCPYTNKNRYEMKVHVIRKHSNEYNYECEQCGKKYKIKGDLTNHIRFQHREQPIICDVCGKTCGNSNSLYVHQKFAHYKAEFECPICKRRMVSQANLDEHVLKQHEQREDAICEECGKTFTRQSRLKIHMRIHLGIKPHSCKLCGKAFSRKTALRQHLLIHSGQRPYLCDICGKSFTQKPGLISHRKSHPGNHPPLPRVTIDHVLSDLLLTTD